MPRITRRYSQPLSVSFDICDDSFYHLALRDFDRDIYEEPGEPVEVIGFTDISLLISTTIMLRRLFLRAWRCSLRASISIFERHDFSSLLTVIQLRFRASVLYRRNSSLI